MEFELAASWTQNGRESELLIKRAKACAGMNGGESTTRANKEDNETFQQLFVAADLLPLQALELHHFVR